MSCQHPACSCSEATIERDGRRYCSEHCAKQGADPGSTGGCSCGHSGCNGATSR
jgi:hypothetical protein